jgi:hypothetical protein
VLVVIVLGVRTSRINRGSLAEFSRPSDLTPKQLDDRIPKQLGDYRLTRTWQEQLRGITVLENAAYRKDESSEITVGIWLSPSQHSVLNSMMIHGESTEMLSRQSFVTAGGQPVFFDTAFYSDGITDSLVGNTYCSPSVCRSSLENEGGIHVVFNRKIDFATRGTRFVPIFFRVERLHTGAPKADTYKELTAESQGFLSGVDFPELSKGLQ